MTGILLLFVMATWLAIAVWVSRTIAKKIPLPDWRMPIGILMFVVLLPLPLIDEIVGGRQFEKLCKENTTIQVNRATAVGKTVYFLPKPDVEIEGTWVRVVLQPHQFTDAKTDELVFSYNTLTAVGGRFIRALGISEGGMPMTFNGTCGPEESVKNLVNSLGISALDRPTQENKGN